MNLKKCEVCGADIIPDKNIKGQMAPYKDAPSLELNQDFITPGCSKCDNFVLEGGRAKELDAILEPQYQKWLVDTNGKD